MHDDRTSQMLPQGDPGLLETATARQLLALAIPARMAYVATDGTPRIVPTWFEWTGTSIVMATWVSGPHVSRPARRIADLAVRPEVAISVDTDDQPPRCLQVRGRAEIEIVDGIVPEYRRAAIRYLGAEVTAGYLGQFDGVAVSMARIAVQPEWVGVLDFDARLPEPLGGLVGA